MSDIEMAMKDVIATIGEKISMHALDDSEQEFANMLLELDQQNESFSSMMKLSAIASLMAISSFLPANALAKELGKAKQVAAMQGQKFTKDSP
jgi:translation elongation factor EF-Ts